MDPWQDKTSINTPAHAEEPVELLLAFENSFISDSSDIFDTASRNQALIHKTPVSFEKLPDSEEYLAKLEAKLGKLRVGGNLAKGKAVGSGRKEEEGLVSSMRNAQATRLASNRSAPIHVLVLVDTTPGALQSTTTPSAPVPRVTGETPSLAAPSSPK